MLTAAEVEAIVDCSVERTLERLGFQLDDPTAVQRDLAHLRSWRESTEAIKRTGLITAVGVLVSGALGLVWIIFKEHFKW